MTADKKTPTKVRGVDAPRHKTCGLRHWLSQTCTEAMKAQKKGK